MRLQIVIAFTLSLLLAEQLVEAAEMQVLHDLKYLDDGDLRNVADVYIPPGEGPFPAVLMVHGGAWVSGSKSHMSRHAGAFVDAGYTVVAINYRFAPRHKFPSQIEDCLAAIRWMRTNAVKFKIDTARIAGYGYSAGAQLVSLIGACQELHTTKGEAELNTQLQCVIAGGTPCDFRTIPKDVDFMSFYLGGTRGNVPEAYEKASSAAYVSKDDPPMFFFHGQSDILVPIGVVEEMNRNLEKSGVKSELYVVPHVGHLGAFLDTRPTKKAILFLDSVLKEKKKDTE